MTRLLTYVAIIGPIDIFVTITLLSSYNVRTPTASLSHNDTTHAHYTHTTFTLITHTDTSLSLSLSLSHAHTHTGIWRQKNVKIKKNVISFFGADVTSDVGIHVNKGTYVRHLSTFIAYLFFKELITRALWLFLYFLILSSYLFFSCQTVTFYFYCRFSCFITVLLFQSDLIVHEMDRRIEK